MKIHGSKIKAIFLLCLALCGGGRVANAACTLGTNVCCQNGGGAGDTAATQIVWQPDQGTTVWNTTGNWFPRNIPDAATEYAYIQADWQIPAYPANSYTLSCLKIASGTMTANPASPTVTMTIASSATVTAPLSTTGTATLSTPGSSTTTLPVKYLSGITMRVPTATVTISTPSATLTISAVATGTGRITFSSAHGLTSAATDGTPIVFSGSLPAPLVAGTTYYATRVSNTVITLSTTAGGGLLALTTATTGGTAVRQGGQVSWASHALTAGEPVVLTGTLPAGLTSGTIYYAAATPAIAAGNFWVTTTPGGGPVGTTSAGTGTFTGRRNAVTWAGHGLVNGDPVIFNSTLTLSGVTAGQVYYVNDGTIATGTNTFSFSATVNGALTDPTGAGTGTLDGRIPLKVSWTGHGLSAGSPVQFTNAGGALPTGLTAGTVYYVATAPTLTANDFYIATTVGGNAIGGTAAGTGTHTVYGTTIVTQSSHGLTSGTAVAFSTTGTLPTGILPGTVYYVSATPAPATNTYALTTVAGNAPFTASGSQSGTHTAYTPGQITWALHALTAGTSVQFSNSAGSLPTEIVSDAVYYVVNTPVIGTNTFSISATVGGNPIAFTGTSSGVHTGKRPGVVNLAAHGLTAGSPVSFTTTGTLPGGLTAGTTYYVAVNPAPAAGTFSVSGSSDGNAIAFTGVQAGTHTLVGANVLTIGGEFFTNRNTGSLTTGSGFVIKMAGAADQTFDNVDNITKLFVTNPTTVTMPSAFAVTESISIAGGAGAIKIQAGLNLRNAIDRLSIPSSATVEVQNGAVLTAAGGIEVSGVLKISAGGTVLIGNGKTLLVKPGGVLQIIGNSGAVAKLDAVDGSSSYILSVQGSINANYFSISRMTAAGLNITSSGSDTIQTLSNGEFHYLASGGYAVTLNTAKSLPTSPNPTGLGFFDDFGFANVKNFNATTYTGSAVTISQWSGLGDTAYETDPSNKISWGTAAPVALQVTNRTAANNPPATIGRASADTLFATFGFALNGASTSSDITSIRFTLGGNNTSSDIASAKVYKDVNGNCLYDAGTDTLIGSALTFVNDPPVTTLTIPVATISVNNSAQKCIHVLLATSGNARLNSTIQIKIAGTEDVTNTQGYVFSSASGPPVQGPLSTITVAGVSTKVWNGGNTNPAGSPGSATDWAFNAGNWLPSGLPAATDDCQIGPAYSYPVLNGPRTCNNVTLPDNGRMSWAGTSDVYTILGSLEIGSNYTFTTATAGNISFASTTDNQSIYASTTFPGNVTVNNTATGGVVSVDSNFTIDGDLTLTAGTLRVPSGNTLTVNGNVNVNGGKLKIEAGAYIKLGDGRTLTVGAAGTLELVGTVSQAASFDCVGTTTGCAAVINGTIKAQYYSFNRLAVAGVTINSGATIDSTYYLQNGAFTYPIGTNPKLITLNRQVPGNSWNNMTFDLNGSLATGAKSVVTGAAVAAGTLVVSNYSGNLAGDLFDSDPSYVVTWTSPTTTLKLLSKDTSGTATITIASPAVVTYASHGLISGATLSFTTTGALPTGLTAATTYYVAASPAPTTNTFSVAATLGGAAIITSGIQSGVHTATSNANNTNQGDTALRAGWWSFQQTDPGAYGDTNLTSVKITLAGTGASSDVSSGRLYYDSACAGTGGTQIGSAQTFSGSPPSITFAGLSGVTVQSHATSPPQRCLYMEFDVASAATSGATLIAKISGSGDVVNSQGFSFNGSFAPPKSGRTLTVIGNTLTWTGAVSTDWNNPLNWSPNTTIPNSSKNCIINNVTFDPIISAAGAVCKSITIGNGILTINSGQTLSVYGSLTNTGTIVQPSSTATITIRDDGSSVTNQTLQSSSALDYLVFNKIAGGYVYVGNNNLTINHFSIPAGQNFTFNVRNGDTLTLPDAATLTSAVFQVDGGGTVAIAPTKTFLVNGGTLKLGGVNDGYPQLTSNKATLTHSGGGTGTWTFLATSGTLDLNGWLVEWLDCNGMQINGTTTVSSLAGGQLRNIPTPTSCSPSTLYAMQFNTSGSLPATADYVGFNWGPTNTPPSPSEIYYLLKSTGCNNQTLNFTNWFGDWQFAVNTPDPATKVQMTNCGATIAPGSSPVTFANPFRAVAYNAVVQLLWSTGMEIMHQGFNLYRSTSPSEGFAQINSTLIRNPIQSGTVHGNYDFRDSGVTNGVTYYYRLEDIAVNGTRKFYGPVSATPQSSLSAAPAASSGAIVSGNANGGGAPTSDESTPGIVAVAPGVTQLAKTKNSMRLRIDVPALDRSPSDVAGYDQVAIAGYASSTEAGFPELPERVILVEVPGAAAASFREVSRTAANVSPIDIVAARTWTVSGGSLVSTRVFDGPFYGTSQMLPAEPVAFKDIVENNGLYFLPIVMRPVKYNPVTRVANAISQITFDVHLSGAPQWNVDAPVTESGPWGYEGALRIHIKKAGLYRLRYSDLVAAGVEGPFVGANVNKLRLFSKLGELPLQVTSGGLSFGPGDEIRFFAPYFDTHTTDRNTLVLYRDTVTGLRMAELDGTPGGVNSTQSFFRKRFDVKKASLRLFNEPIANDVEHIYWGRIYSPVTSPGDDTLRTDIDLKNLAASGNVQIRISLKGGAGPINKNPDHHLRLYVNGGLSPSGDTTFRSIQPYSTEFVVPASQFVEGRNSVELRAVGDLVGTGDYDVINIEKVSIDYPHTFTPDGDVADIQNTQAGNDVTISGFTSGAVSVYDISLVTGTALIQNSVVTAEGGGGYSAKFTTNLGSSSLGRRLVTVADGAALSPWSLELNPGSNWKGTAQGADVLYIGPRRLLSAAARLADWRHSTGSRTALVPTEDIYLEFGQGIRSPAAIRNFIAYAYANWQTPAPKYVVLIGDATYDPKNQLGYGLSSGVPTYFSKGASWDYGNDNYYVALEDGSDVPLLAIGRIPGRTAGAIATYIDKVINYESGATNPTGEAAKRVTVISDIDQNGGEKFDEKADRLASLLPNQWNSFMTVNRLKRSTMSDAALKNQILNSFNNGSLFVHYLGHGAENVWADNAVFSNADAEALTNTALPIVVAMNCLNGMYYDADQSVMSLADKLIFNANGGAVAMFASTSLTSPDLQVPVQDALYQYVATHSGARLGDAIRMAKISGGISVGTAEVTGSWTLFGDPMLKVIVPTIGEAVLGVVKSEDGNLAISPAVGGEGEGGGGSCLSVHSDKPVLPGWGTIVNLLVMIAALVGGRLMVSSPKRVPVKVKARRKS